MGQALIGLTTAEAQQRLIQYGYNEVSEVQPNKLLKLLQQFWSPVPWMLEVTILITVLIAHYIDTVVISVLLVFNALVSFLQQNQAENALELLRHRLAVNARVLRDGQWTQVPGRELVTGDVIHVRMGDMIPADLHLLDGSLVLDQSPLTGESVPVDKTAGDTAYSGAVVKHGEATGQVTATGTATYFGKTTELVKTAKTASHLGAIIMRIVRYLIIIDSVLVLATLLFAQLMHISLLNTLPFALIILVASVPAALPATFTLAQALGSKEMAKQGVLITRLSAIEEAATMDILCTDKTGTITENMLSVGQLLAYPPFTEKDVIAGGALASDAASEDPLDTAILAEQEKRLLDNPTNQRITFTAFDPALKRTEATIKRGADTIRIIKGAPQVVAQLVGNIDHEAISRDVSTLADHGYRVLAVAQGSATKLQLVGLIGLFDPPRADSAALIASLHHLGVETKLLTGDTVETARAVAQQVGIDATRVYDASTVHEGHEQPETHVSFDVTSTIYAGIFPEDKFHLVQALQQAQHVTGMTGDGVNDAPALKQAEVGIAVASATDVAKAAAGIVLTTPGLMGVVAAVETSRRIYQRMQTYTLNKIIKTMQVAIFLTLGFFITLRFVTTPHLVVLLLFANDFVTMSIATDNATPSPKPDRWQIRQLVGAALALTLILLFESFLLLWVAIGLLHLSFAQGQTLIFLMLVFTGQTTVYVVRERRFFWASRPSRMLLLASLADVVVVSLLAIFGILMTPVNPLLVLLVLVLAVLFMGILDGVKIQVFRRLGIT